MGLEVKRQRAGPEYVVGMAKAMDYVYSHDITDLYDIHMVQNHVTLNTMRLGYRNTPVTFANGGGSCNAAHISEAMERLETIGLQRSVIREEVPVDDWIKQFLWIHPYPDGNGRTAAILRNWLMGTLDNPSPLPDYFGEKEEV